MPNIGVIIKKMVHRSYKGVFVMSMIIRHLLITVVPCMIGRHECLSFAKEARRQLPEWPLFHRYLGSRDALRPLTKYFTL